MPGWWVVSHMPDAAPSVLFSQFQGHQRGERASGEVTGMEAGNFAARVLHKVLDISEHLAPEAHLSTFPAALQSPSASQATSPPVDFPRGTF